MPSRVRGGGRWKVICRAVLVAAEAMRGRVCVTFAVAALIACPADAEEAGPLRSRPEMDEVRALIEAERWEEAEPLLRRLLAEAEVTHGAGSIEAARARTALGLSLLMQEGVEGKTEEAQRLGEEALPVLEAAQGPDAPEVAGALELIARARNSLGDGGGWHDLDRRALAIRERQYGPESVEFARALHGYAHRAHLAGFWAEGLEAERRAIGILERVEGPDHPDVAAALNNLGYALWDYGDLAGAREAFERALAIDDPVAPEDPGYALTHGGLALVLARMGDYAAARRHFDRARDIFELAVGEGLYDPGAPLDAWDNAPAAYYNYAAHGVRQRANFLARAGEPDEAEALFRRAVALFERRELDYGVGFSLCGLGTLESQTGRHREAKHDLARGLEILEKMVPGSPPVVECMLALANLLRDTGDYTGARSLYEKVLDFQEEWGGGNHPAPAITEGELSGVLYRLGEPEALERSLASEDGTREHFRITARSLTELQALRYAAVRSSGLAVALSLAAGGARPDAAGRVWDSLVRSRALILDEMAARRRALARSGDPEVAKLEERLAAASRRLANLTLGAPDGDPGRYRRIFEAGLAEQQQAEKALAARSVEFRAGLERERVGLDAVVASLPPGSALVAYALHERLPGATQPGASGPGVPSYTAFVTRQGASGPVVVSLGTAAEIDGRVAAWRRAIALEGAPVPSSARRDAGYRAAAVSLRAAVWDPVAPHVAGASRVFLVPDGALHLVSWAALPDGDRYLVEGGAVFHYLSAERDLVRVEPDTAGAGLLAMGGADFDAVARLEARPAALPAGEAGPDGIPDLGPDLGPARRSACGDVRLATFPALPGAAREAREVAEIWAATAQVGGDSPDPAAVRLTGPAATEAAFKARAPGRRVVHLATHGFFLGSECPSAAGRGVGGVGAAGPGLEGPGAPASVASPGPGSTPASVSGENPLLLSGLVLAGANRRERAGPDEEDGVLTAEEIAAMDLSGVEWAVLSACDTGRGEVRAGEGVLGLRRAFQVAGARTLILSLWSVEDDSTREWMRALYEGRLSQGLDTAEAVREASLSVLNARRARSASTHPFYWAGFVAAGDWR
jgi:CHAT domain-containing protein/tetratricopeptide (TPR) repeat protein